MSQFWTKVELILVQRDTYFESEGVLFFFWVFVCMPLEALTGGFSGVSNPMNMAPFGQQYDYSIYLSHVHLFFPSYGWKYRWGERKYGVTNKTDI